VSNANNGLHATEMLKLAAALNCPTSQLQALTPLKAGELRKLRTLYQDIAFRRFAPLCRRLAQATRLLPKAVSSQLAESVFGPQLSAHIMVHMPARHFSKIAERLEDEFLANLLHYLDGRRAADLLADIPLPLAERLIHACLLKQDFPALAELAEQLPRDQVLSLAEALQSPADLIRVSRYITDKPSLTQLVSGLNENLVAEALLASKDSPELTDAALELLSFMPVAIQHAAAAQGMSSSPETTAELARLAITHPRRSALEAFIQSCR